MAASPRRVGAETSKTRDTLLDCVETMLLEEGYASVSYRALAAKAGVTASLVQYYFPSLDEIFLAAIRRYSDRNLELFRTALQKRPQDPLHAMWEYSWDEATGALITEFMALGNHRKSIRSAIAEVTERMRKLQIGVLCETLGADARLEGELSLGAVVLLITGIPKFLNWKKVSESKPPTQRWYRRLSATSTRSSRLSPEANARPPRHPHEPVGKECDGGGSDPRPAITQATGDPAGHAEDHAGRGLCLGYVRSGGYRGGRGEGPCLLLLFDAGRVVHRGPA